MEFLIPLTFIKKFRGLKDNMSATQNESKRDYVRKLEELDINASDFDNKFDEINQQFNRNLEVSHKSYGIK